jgi:coenzyme F420 hydrogenase subunit beta
MKCYLSYSLDKDVRYRSSSCGFCKEFIRFLIENKIVDKAIITVLGEDDKSLVPETIITNDIEKIMSTKSNTIYDITNPLSVLRRLSSNEKYVFVGLPCHVKPLKKYCKKKNINIFTISLFCNHTANNNKYYKSILDKVKLIEKDVKHFEYRGSGWPGFVTIQTNDGREIKLKHKDCWSNYKKSYLDMLDKCKKCTEFISYEADICVGDAWLKEIQDFDDQGTCIVLSMNPNADEVVKSCFEKNYIYLKQIEQLKFNNYYKFLLNSKLKRRN